MRIASVSRNCSLMTMCKAEKIKIPTFNAQVCNTLERVYTRVKFRIWPGRGAPIENVYKSEIVAIFKKIEPDYEPWMVSINNEIDEKPVAIEPFRLPRDRDRGN